jgi:ribonuclease P protein subunit RPR2
VHIADQNAMTKKKSFQGRDAFHRMNFLYQACTLLQAVPNASNLNISAHYGSIMTSVAKKSVLRMDTTIKRTLCKGCNNLMVPGTTARVRIKKINRGQTQHICTQCLTVKRFNLKKEHKLWYEKEESVVEVIKCEEESPIHIDITKAGDTRK